MQRIFPAITLLLILLFVPGCSAVAEFANPAPSDAVLEKRLRDRREDFEELVRMFQQDSKLYRIDQNGVAMVDLANVATLPPDRSDSYRVLMLRAGVNNISRRFPNTDEPPSPTINFSIWRVEHNFFGFKEKQYVYKISGAGRMVDSLDKIYRTGEDANAYKKIDDDWSLYLDVW